MPSSPPVNLCTDKKASFYNYDQLFFLYFFKFYCQFSTFSISNLITSLPKTVCAPTKPCLFSPRKETFDGASISDKMAKRYRALSSGNDGNFYQEMYGIVIQPKVLVYFLIYSKGNNVFKNMYQLFYLKSKIY